MGRNNFIENIPCRK